MQACRSLRVNSNWLLRGDARVRRSSTTISDSVHLYTNSFGASNGGRRSLLEGQLFLPERTKRTHSRWSLLDPYRMPNMTPQLTKTAASY
ncbi:hypothetical protein M404DRAFT_245562 [Pisolithus tinctorius Marx 270]|uniref:Uncharacterized protein n=1 Tax=Pisolithus tinctorius Marx 270 TaxID=870435 RepID=A0A0C3JFV7_PISTI|nr:hypothetical protein M404DRAFT_245562 [Pisolithus tinctorius Marx 270]